MQSQLFDGLTEWPLVTREECWRAYRPAQPFSESAFQRLRRNDLVSPGVRALPRSNGHLQGQSRCFSRLNLLALDACRIGDEDEARRLSAMAADLESHPDLQDLVDLLAMDGEDVEQHRLTGAGRAHELMQRVCAATDSWHAKARHVPTRMPAQVSQVVDGMADLILRAGQHVYYSEIKLSRIGRDRPGEVLFLYLVDLEGTDELVRARPALWIDMTRPGKSPGHDPGAFDHVVTDIREADADLLDALLAEEKPEQSVDLTGLRIVP